MYYLSPWKNGEVERGLLGVIHFLWAFEAFIEHYCSFQFGLLKPNHVKETLAESQRWVNRTASGRESVGNLKYT